MADDAQYFGYDNAYVTTCRSCPAVQDDGWYVWCPNCGSNQVLHH